MKKIKFFEVNFGGEQILPVMTAKCFSTRDSALNYLFKVKSELLERLQEERGESVVVDDYREQFDLNHCGAVLVLVVKDSFCHVKVYEIKLIQHSYCLED